MRIRKLELQNFKGFAGHHSIDFQAACKNLLVLGENGSGKTSIVKALEGAAGCQPTGRGVSAQYVLRPQRSRAGKNRTGRWQ